MGQYFLFVQYSCRNSHHILIGHPTRVGGAFVVADGANIHISYLAPLALHHVLRRAGTRVHP